MIEITILDHLKSAMPNVLVALERPATVPDKFIIFEKTSSGKSNYVQSATFAFQSYSKKSMYEAALLNEQLKAVVESMVALDSIASVRLNSDYNFTDTSTKEYRYQAVFDFKY